MTREESRARLYRREFRAFARYQDGFVAGRGFVDQTVQLRTGLARRKHSFRHGDPPLLLTVRHVVRFVKPNPRGRTLNDILWGTRRPS